MTVEDLERELSKQTTHLHKGNPPSSTPFSNTFPGTGISRVPNILHHAQPTGPPPPPSVLSLHSNAAPVSSSTKQTGI